MSSNGGKWDKNSFLRFFVVFLLFVWKICLKAPGNDSDQFCCDQILVLLCEGPKPNISMISGFLSPGEPLFMDLNTPEYFKTYKKIWKHFGKYYFCKSGNPFFDFF